MLKKELEKEGWISFEKGTDLNKEIPNIEIGRFVFECRKYHGMYNAGSKKKLNPYLEKRWEEISTFKRELENIRNICIIRKANVNNNRSFENKYLIIEDRYGPNVVLDLNNGWDESYRFKRLFLTQNTKIEWLYRSTESSEPMQLSKIEKVIYYPNAILVNDFTKTNVIKGYVLEIIDTLNNKLYVDCYNKKLFYYRDNYSVINNNKRIELFNNDLSTDIPDHILGLKQHIKNALS